RAVCGSPRRVAASWAGEGALTRGAQLAVGACGPSAPRGLKRWRWGQARLSERAGPAETDWAGTGFAWAERGIERVGRGERERAGPPEVGPGGVGLGCW